LVLPGKVQDDNESATSNVLAKVLNLQGQVLIGDKALKHYLQNADKAIDLAELWYKRQNLPFVFARLCYHSDSKRYKKLSNAFLRSSQKIPQYILKKASARTQIDQKDIVEYLTLIEYRLDPHAKLSLKRFLRLASTL
jgi:chorismate dehydratase